jgi:hypothetical protein
MSNAHRARFRDKLSKADAPQAEPRAREPRLYTVEARIADLRDKRRRASEFAHQLADMEGRARDEQERSSLAARRRDVEVEASSVEHLIFKLQSEAADEG